MQQLTPEQAIERARQTYTEGVEYKSVFEPDSDYTDKVADNREKQRKIKLAEIEKEFGISVGDVIEYNGKKGIVSRIDADSAKPFYYLPFKKDGKPSVREVWCYSTDKIKLIEKCQHTI